MPGSMLKDDATRVQTRLEELAHILESTEEAAVLLHPNMAQRYHQQVRDLITALNDQQFRGEAAELLRGLIDKIVLVPDAEKKELAIDLHGDLAGIFSLATGRGLASGLGTPAANHGKLLEGSRNGPKLADNEIQQVKMVAGGHNQLLHAEPKNQQEKVVAGAGFEATTFRL